MEEQNTNRVQVDGIPTRSLHLRVLLVVVLSVVGVTVALLYFLSQEHENLVSEPTVTQQSPIVSNSDSDDLPTAAEIEAQLTLLRRETNSAEVTPEEIGAQMIILQATEKDDQIAPSPEEIVAQLEALSAQ